jgi:hypothetical protein
MDECSAAWRTKIQHCVEWMFGGPGDSAGKLGMVFYFYLVLYTVQCCGSGSESGSVRIRIIFQDLDPFPFPGCLGSGSVSYSNGTTKLTGRGNLTKNTFCVVPVGPNYKKKRGKMV